jgi:hypothetical protein
VIDPERIRRSTFPETLASEDQGGVELSIRAFQFGHEDYREARVQALEVKSS